MPALVEQTPGSEGRTLEIKSGASSIGCAPDCDLVLSSPGVAIHHAEVVWNAEGIYIRDLGSGFGTLVNDSPIESVWLIPGCVVKIGEATLAYLEQAPVSGHAAIDSFGEMCSLHTQKPAVGYCNNCRSLLCLECTRPSKIAGAPGVVCRACNRACVPIDLWQADRNRLNKSFFTLAPSAFTYPVRGFGLMVVALLTVFFTMLRFFILVPTQGIPVAIIGFGYLVTVMRQVINSTAAGEDAFREWPDFAHLWDDLILPFFQFLGVFLLCLGPGFALAATAWNPLLGFVLLILGAVCLPMAILMVAMADALSALNPLLLFASIAKVPKEYLLTCALFVVTLAGNAWFQRVMADSAWRGFNPILHLFTAYALMIEARLLGLLYRTCEKRLGWFA